MRPFPGLFLSLKKIQKRSAVIKYVACLEWLVKPVYKKWLIKMPADNTADT